MSRKLGSVAILAVCDVRAKAALENAKALPSAAQAQPAGFQPMTTEPSVRDYAIPLAARVFT